MSVLPALGWCVTGLIAGVALYPAFIGMLATLHAGQRVSAYGPSSHSAKAGTPTMGGLLFCSLAIAIWLGFDRSQAGFLLAFAVVAGAAIGALDDIANIKGVGELGLPARSKLALQGVAGVLIGIGLLERGASAQVVPFLGVIGFSWLIVPVAAFAVVATSNAVNLSDGVDGLAATLSAIAVLAFLFLAVVAGHHPAVVLLTAFALGTLLAFLVFNWYPARIFMGDTGSLALGCLFVAVSSELHVLGLLPWIGLIFVIEVLSVIINVAAIKKFRRRVFRSSPLHHHFEDLGFSEQRIVFWFGAVAALAAATAIYWVRAAHLP